MASLLDPALLPRTTQPGEDPTGIQTLLGAIGSALSGGVAQPTDPTATSAALLAAGSALANAGAPTLGPAPTTAQAILGALGGARNAAIQTEILPYMQERARQQLESQNLDYQVKLFDFQRRLNAANLLRQGVSAAADSTGGGPSAAGAPAAAPGRVAPTGDLAALSDVQALPDATRVAAIDAMNRVGMSPDEAAQYARMLMAESQGLHIDPKTNKVMVSPKGASGVAQVMPQTFLDMAQAHDDVTGSNSDLVPNLMAGAHYFHDQVLANNGNLRNGTIAYNMGPDGLKDYLAGNRVLPAETTDYLARTRAPGVQVADASGRVPIPAGGQTPPGVPLGAGNEPLVPVLGMPGLQVPRSVELSARAAGLSAADPYAAYAKVVQDYVEKRALAPHFTPGAVPGVQTNVTTNETTAAPVGATGLTPIKPAERAAMFPQIPAWQDIVVTRDPSGRITDYKLPEMGPEPQKPISDAQAQKPVEEGGAGNSYRPGTAYAVGARTGLVKPIQIERGAGIPGADEGAPVLTPGQLQRQQQVFQQTQELENQVVHSPVYAQWAQGAQRFDAVLASLNQRTRVGDQAAIESLAKVFDPSAVVTEGKLTMAANYGGVQQQLQNALGKITGESGLPDSVRQQMVDLAVAEMKTRDAAVLGQIARSRASAQAKGLNPDQVMPLFQTTALTKADSEARRAPKGIELAPPVSLKDGQFVREEAATPAATLAVPSAAQFAAMSAEGLKALVADGQQHPERYSQDYRVALGAELQRRGGVR